MAYSSDIKVGRFDLNPSSTIVLDFPNAPTPDLTSHPFLSRLTTSRSAEATWLFLAARGGYNSGFSSPAYSQYRR